ncbi:MAG TPA: hypothetical protein VE338_15860 [Ktedonobacterales bacterium]|jgi:hypothetical protein|nr:hypothetical protein [Ktedonobacterales bacterium]
MTFDPLNIPFQQPAPFITSGESAVGQAAGQELKAESILLEEFGYAGVSAYQARQDSAALINLYLLATGALATGLGVMVNAYGGANRPTIGMIAIAALSIFAIFSFAFFARFLALEQEYRESVLAMSVIKEFYIQRLRRDAPEIELAFHWRLRKRPRGATLAGGVPLIAWTVALLSGLSIAGAVGEARQLYSILANVSIPYTPEPVLGASAPFAWELLLGLLAVGAHLAYYVLVARRQRERTQREAAEQAARIERALSAHE